LTRPTGAPANGDYWLDTTVSDWGIFEWDQTTAVFTNVAPLVITDATDTVSGNGTVAGNTPKASVGSVGDYAVVAVGVNIFGYYKRASDNTWNQIGSNAWKTSWPAITGSAAPTSLTAGSNIYINDNLITVGDGGTALTTSGFATAINNASITGVTATATSNVLRIYADSTAANDGSTLSNNGIVTIDAGIVGGSALLTALGISAGEYAAPDYEPAYSYEQPRWRTTDTDGGRPTGSVWQNLSIANNGLNLSLKSYSAALGTFVSQTVPAYATDTTAIYNLDPTGGGKNIPVGTSYAVFNSFFYSTTPLTTFAFEINNRYATGALEVTGTTTPTSFTLSNSFNIAATAAGQSTNNTGIATIGGLGEVADFITAVSAANIPFVSASVNAAGNIVFTHSQGGTIFLSNAVGTPLTAAGFTLSTDKVRQSPLNSAFLVLSNFVNTPLFTYTASPTAPDQDPADGRLWYYSAVDEVDIMIQDNGTWQGYQLVTNDVRGNDLTLCNETGPIISATAPTTQTDTAESPLAYGDLWVDTSDLENYPKLYRWESVSGLDQWVEIDTTDQVTQNGILFADARWAPNGTTDPVADPIPSIGDLLDSSYLDPDAPNPALYPQGMLLFNTRRSGYNVKSFQSSYFTTTATDYAIDVWSATTTYTANTFVSYNNGIYVCILAPTANQNPSNGTYWALINLNTWLTTSGNRDDGAMWSGRLAQRQLIVQALKSGIDTSVTAREEQTQFNIIATPAYPELTPNMIALSNERNNTLFVVGDTPMRLGPDGNSLVAFATDNNGLGQPNGDGNSATSNYCGVFYPSCQTTDLGGNTVVATSKSHDGTHNLAQ
jgi:hypothetical protein